MQVVWFCCCQNLSFFYLGLFTNIYYSQDSRGRGRVSPFYHFQPLHRYLDISRVITAESSPLHIASSRTRTKNLWFPSNERELWKLVLQSSSEELLIRLFLLFFSFSFLLFFFFAFTIFTVAFDKIPARQSGILFTRSDLNIVFNPFFTLVTFDM